MSSGGLGSGLIWALDKAGTLWALGWPWHCAELDSRRGCALGLSCFWVAIWTCLRCAGLGCPAESSPPLTIMDCYGGIFLAVTVGWYGGLYIAIIMGCYTLLYSYYNGLF
jgi:hypothetical protein